MAKRPRVMTTAEIMRANPHPVTTLLKARGWNDADPHPWRPQVDYDWAADGWLATWRVTRARLETYGLVVTIREASVEDATGFIAIWLEVEESQLPRAHTSRGFELHISIGKLHNYYNAAIVYEAISRINARWAGRTRRLTIGHMAGTAVLATDDLLACDVDLTWLHDRGCYSDRPIHISL